MSFGSREDVSGYDCCNLSCLETTGWQTTHWRSHLPRSLAKNGFYVFQGLKKRGEYATETAHGSVEPKILTV